MYPGFLDVQGGALFRAPPFTRSLTRRPGTPFFHTDRARNSYLYR